MKAIKDFIISGTHLTDAALEEFMHDMVEKVPAANLKDWLYQTGRSLSEFSEDPQRATAERVKRVLSVIEVAHEYRSAPAVLDDHRGMNGLRDTETRRNTVEVLADQAAIRARYSEFERLLLTGPSTTRIQAAEKIRYLLRLYAKTEDAQDPRRQQLIASALDDLDTLSE